MHAKSGKEHRLNENMHERLKYKIFAHALETARFRTLPDAYAQQEYCYDLCILVYPSYYYPYFRQMELALEQGDKQKALDHARRMIENGYTDKGRLLSSKAGQQLREYPEFRSLLDRMNVAE